MARRTLVTLLVVTATAVVVTATAVGCYVDSVNVRRIHAKSLREAEQFKRDFDQQFQPGADQSLIDEYLRTKSVAIRRSIHFSDDLRDDWIGTYRVETANIRSFVWGCGRESVGVVLQFTRDLRLIGTEATSWSFDCM